MIKKIYILLTVMLAVIGTRQVHAQGIAIKTNFAGWAALAGNVGAEFCVSECSSVEVSFYKSIADCYIKNANFTALQLGYKYWFSRTPLNSFFIGASVTPAKYKCVIDDTDRKGYAFPFGVNLGYCLPLGERFNIEFSYGIGGTYINEDIISPTIESEMMTRHKMSFTPTNIGINVSYIIK